MNSISPSFGFGADKVRQGIRSMVTGFKWLTNQEPSQRTEVIEKLFADPKGIKPFIGSLNSKNTNSLLDFLERLVNLVNEKAMSYKLVDCKQGLITTLDNAGDIQVKYASSEEKIPRVLPRSDAHFMFTTSSGENFMIDLRTTDGTWRPETIMPSSLGAIIDRGVEGDTNLLTLYFVSNSDQPVYQSGYREFLNPGDEFTKKLLGILEAKVLPEIRNQFAERLAKAS